MKITIGALLLAGVCSIPAYATPSGRMSASAADETRVQPKDKKDDKSSEKPKTKPREKQADPPSLPPSAIPGAKNGNAGGGSGGGNGNKGGGTVAPVTDGHCKGSSDCSKLFDGGK